MCISIVARKLKEERNQPPSKTPYVFYCLEKTERSNLQKLRRGLYLFKVQRRKTQKNLLRLPM